MRQRALVESQYRSCHNTCVNLRHSSHYGPPARDVFSASKAVRAAGGFKYNDTYLYALTCRPMAFDSPCSSDTATGALLLAALTVADMLMMTASAMLCFARSHVFFAIAPAYIHSALRVFTLHCVFSGLCDPYMWDFYIDHSCVDSSCRTIAATVVVAAHLLDPCTTATHS